MKGNRYTPCNVLLCLLLIGAGWKPATAQVDSDQQASSGVVESIDAYTESGSTANQLSMAADYALAHHDYDKAIALCHKAQRMDDNDLEIHKSYALALEGKLQAEKSNDANLFNACLREWLIVMRTERGPEKLTSFHGITVPGMAHLYRDEDYEMLARMHVRGLTGSTPKAWETDDVFLKRAGKDTTSTVTGKILKRPPDPASSSTRTIQAAPTPATAPPDPLDWLKQ